jgi:hypothetical protein
VKLNPIEPVPRATDRLLAKAFDGKIIRYGFKQSLKSTINRGNHHKKSQSIELGVLIFVNQPESLTEKELSDLNRL